MLKWETVYVGPQEPSEHQRSAFPIWETWGTCSSAYSATFRQFATMSGPIVGGGSA